MSDTTTKTRLLSNRGIGKRYHTMSLTEYPHAIATELVKWVEGDAISEVQSGKGILFFGETEESYDIAILTARAFILKGMNKLQCVPFQLALEYDTLKDLWTDKPPLLITNFKPDSGMVDPERYARLETLINYYLDNCIPILFHIPADFEGQNYGTLISPVLLDRILKNNNKFTIS